MAPSPEKEGKRLVRVESLQAGKRLDVFLAAVCPDVASRRQARILCEQAAVSVNGKTARAGLLLQADDLIEYAAPAFPSPDAVVVASVKIIAETDDLLIIEKPRGLHSVEHFGSTAPALSSVLRLRRLAKGIGEELPDEGLLQRLDYWTSGLLLAAKTAQALEKYRRLMSDQRMCKSYVAVVSGTPERQRYTIDAAIDAAKRARVRLSQQGIPAKSELRVLHRLPQQNCSWVLISGRQMRRHQVRVHCAAIGHPLLHDRLYEGTAAADSGADAEKEESQGFFLHARSLKWSLPAEGPRASLPFHFTSDAWRSWPLTQP